MGGGKSQGSFFRIPSLITAQMAGILWVLFFFGGWGVGWLVVCWRRIGRERQRVMYVCVCVSVRGRSGQVQVR